MPKLSRRRLLAAAAPIAAAPVLGKLALTATPAAAEHGLQTHEHGHHAMGHAAMIGDEAPAVGGPNDLDALLHPAAGAAAPARAACASTRSSPSTGEIEVAPGVFFAGVDVQRHRARPGDPRDRGRHSCASASSTPARTRTRSTSTASTRRTWTASSRSSSRASEFTYEFEARPAGHAPLPLPRDAAEEAHPQGPLRRVHHRPAGAAPAGAGARDGDERLRHRRRRREQLLHRQRAHASTTRSIRSRCSRSRDRPHLSRQPDRVRPRSTRSTCTRDFFRYQPTGTGDHWEYTDTVDAVPGPARHHRDRVRAHRASSCSTRTSRSSPSSAGWASSTWSTDGGAGGQRHGGRSAGACWALVPIVLLAVAVGGVRRPRVVGRRPARRRTRRRRTSSTSGASSSSRARSGSASRTRSADDLTIASVTVDDAIVPFTLDGPRDARATALEHDRRAVRLGRGRADLGRRHELDAGSRPSRQIAAAVETPGAERRAASLGYAIIGFLVGVVPIALGLLWLPSLRRADPRWLAAFMALTGGLLTFLGVEALFEALRAARRRCPARSAGPGSSCSGSR